MIKKLCGGALVAAVLFASNSVPAAAASAPPVDQPQWLCKILRVCP